MSCIDAAIIKALVEHIGMNPDDVPIGGGSSGSDLSWKKVYLQKFTTADDYFTYQDLNNDKNKDQIQIGDIFRVRNSDGELCDYIVCEYNLDDSEDSRMYTAMTTGGPSKDFMLNIKAENGKMIHKISLPPDVVISTDDAETGVFRLDQKNNPTTVTGLIGMLLGFCLQFMKDINELRG